MSTGTYCVCSVLERRDDWLGVSGVRSINITYGFCCGQKLCVLHMVPILLARAGFLCASGHLTDVLLCDYTGRLYITWQRAIVMYGIMRSFFVSYVPDIDCVSGKNQVQSRKAAKKLLSESNDKHLFWSVPDEKGRN